jgi:hypothetical protein
VCALAAGKATSVTAIVNTRNKAIIVAVVLFPRILLILLFTIGLFDIFFSFPMFYFLTLIVSLLFMWGGYKTFVTIGSVS